MRTSARIFLLAALLFTSPLPTYAHGKLWVTTEVLIEYVDHRLEQLEGKEKLDQEQAEELNFIHENRDNLQALADFYEMRIEEKELVGISEREEPPAREIQRKSEKEERALSPIETSWPPVKPETAIASQKPLPQPKQMSERKQIDQTNQTNQIKEINQPPQIAQLKPPSPITEQEVRQFVKHYTKRYIQKDVNGFLSLFSFRAVQNGRDGFNEIRKIYSGFFDQSRELHYQLNATRIQIYEDVLISGLFHKNAAIAQARYKLDQIMKENGKKKIWKGDVRWVLVRENGALKILHLDFRYE